MLQQHLDDATFCYNCHKVCYLLHPLYRAWQWLWRINLNPLMLHLLTTAVHRRSQKSATLLCCVCSLWHGSGLLMQWEAPCMEEEGGACVLYSQAAKTEDTDAVQKPFQTQHAPRAMTMTHISILSSLLHIYFTHSLFTHSWNLRDWKSFCFKYVSTSKPKGYNN